MKRPSVFLLVLLGVGVVTLWFTSIWYVPWLRALLPSGSLADYGAIGDSFGAVGSMFAGLGAFAVVVVLVIDLRERRSDLRHRQEEYRPFVSTVVSPQAAEIAEASWKSGVFHLVVAADIELVNATAMPALNVSLESTLEGGGVRVLSHVTVADTPLSAATDADAEKRVAQVQYSVSGDEALGLIRQFEASGGGLLAKIDVKYASLNNVTWKSSVQYELTCPRPPDQDLIRRVAAPASVEYIGSSDDIPGGTNLIVLVASPVPGSWSQARMD